MRTPFTLRFLSALPRSGWVALGLFAALTLAVMPALHLFMAPEHPLHVSNYVITLGGKLMTYAMVAVAMDLVWGYAGILSLGFALFLFVALAVGVRRLGPGFALAALFAVAVNAFGAATFQRAGFERFYFVDPTQRILHEPD